MNIAILIGSVLVVAAAFTSLISFRFGAPLLLVFLLVGLLAGEDGLGLHFNDARAAYFIGSLALAVILFDSGFETRLATLRLAALPAASLSIVGVLITAALIGVVAQFVFGFSWTVGFLFGAIVAPTDAAAVFFLLRVGGLTLRDRVRSTLEIESGTNDPVSIFLTLSLVELIAAPASPEGLTANLLARFILQIGVGGLVGAGGGFAIAQVVNRAKLEPALYPIVVLASALTIYAVAAMAEGSGFLAVYVAGVIAGNARIRHAQTLRRSQEGMTWLSQIAMFLTLGLLANPSQFSGVLGPAVLLAAFLTFIARPLAVWLCLIPFGFTRTELAFISWVGLRGAVSILLAILPAMYAMPEATILFNTTFIVVLASLLIQGWTIGPMARYLGIVVPQRLGPVDRIGLELPGRGDHEIVAYAVHPDSPVAKGERLPRWARPSLLIREGRSMRPHNAGRPQPGDQVYIITSPRYLPLLDRLFARPAPAGADDPRLYGEFALEPEARLGDIARAYGMSVANGDEELTVADLFRRELAGDIEAGDRIAYGPVDLIVRQVNEDHVIEEAGLALEPTRQAPVRIPLFQSPREIAAFFRRGRRAPAPNPADAELDAEAPPPAADPPKG